VLFHLYDHAKILDDHIPHFQFRVMMEYLTENTGPVILQFTKDNNVYIFCFLSVALDGGNYIDLVLVRPQFWVVIEQFLKNEPVSIFHVIQCSIDVDYHMITLFPYIPWAT
jgi:hypothetical protein